jgi:TP901-1 family phage major tail protein
MAKVNGTKMILYFKISGTYQAMLVSETSHSININVDLPDATTKGSGGWSENISGLRSWDCSVDGLYDPTGDVSRQEILTLIENRTEVMVKSTSDSAGDTYWEGTCNIASYSETNDMEQPIGFSMALTGTGELELKTVGS